MSPGRSAEQRRFPRLEVSLKVQGVWRAARGGEQAFAALLLKLSEGGALLRTAAPVPANADVEFSLKLGAQSVRLRGRVRWWRRNGEIRELGVEYSQPSRPVGEYVDRELARGTEERAASRL